MTIPVLNEEGDVIEDHDCESKPQVCWKVFAFHGSCISAFGEEGGHSGLGRSDSEFGVILFFWIVPS